jgi:hypothetical protein
MARPNARSTTVPLQMALDKQGAVEGEDINLECYISPKIGTEVKILM